MQKKLSPQENLHKVTLARWYGPGSDVTFSLLPRRHNRKEFVLHLHQLTVNRVLATQVADREAKSTEQTVISLSQGISKLFNLSHPWSVNSAAFGHSIAPNFQKCWHSGPPYSTKGFVVKQRNRPPFSRQLICQLVALERVIVFLEEGVCRFSIKKDLVWLLNY